MHKASRLSIVRMKENRRMDLLWPDDDGRIACVARRALPSGSTCRPGIACIALISLGTVGALRSRRSWDTSRSADIAGIKSKR
jgi:hypothetical protein